MITADSEAYARNTGRNYTPSRGNCGEASRPSQAPEASHTGQARRPTHKGQRYPVPMLSVRRATIADLDVVVPLFDAYRRFYRAAADLEGARRFLLDRFSHNQSVIFLAFDGDIPIGFTQIYPSFSSVSMARIFILNDLFVSPEARSRGAGAA